MVFFKKKRKKTQTHLRCHPGRTHLGRWAGVEAQRWSLCSLPGKSAHNWTGLDASDPSGFSAGNKKMWWNQEALNKRENDSHPLGSAAGEKHTRKLEKIEETLNWSVNMEECQRTAHPHTSSHTLKDSSRLYRINWLLMIVNTERVTIWLTPNETFFKKWNFTVGLFLCARLHPEEVCSATEPSRAEQSRQQNQQGE